MKIEFEVRWNPANWFKRQFVEINGGFYIRSRLTLFGFEYLSRDMDYWWSDEHRNQYCRFNTLEKAKSRYDSFLADIATEKIRRKAESTALVHK